MQELELKISKKDWLIILVFGVMFSMLITSLQYYLVGYNFTSGIIFGGFLGGFIVFYSMIFITYLNTAVLPKLSNKFWIFLAAIFSFLSGFLGTVSAYYGALFFSLDLISKFEQNVIVFASILGALTYIIGSLLYQFVKMSNQKEYHEKELYKSRIKSLETQLNPHFLFNALNSLAELIHQDKNKAEEAIMQLSQFLRVGMKESTLFTISKELDNVKRYVALENIRFNDKIQLSIDSKAQYNKALLPKFSIQLLVENAIKHGFKNNSNSFKIFIKITKNTKQIFINVQNTPGQVEGEKFGIGLNNLDERLKLLCNGEVKLIDKNSSNYEITLGECSENIISR